jgi:hypothetical protein
MPTHKTERFVFKRSRRKSLPDKSNFNRTPVDVVTAGHHSVSREALLGANLLFIFPLRRGEQ